MFAEKVSARRLRSTLTVEYTRAKSRTSAQFAAKDLRPLRIFIITE
ncbi:hypothetical protein B4U79_16057 [Dinothrombium tinctorium]|uniref:Uncharacterized protein n=1 Tax=Dinothrombium tinctorium TaxID=1965070 RepID=A0A443RKG6_9ACAR|nr:hypothetical protein B4U79_16057 [Dinothrombium tinctorium]